MRRLHQEIDYLNARVATAESQQRKTSERLDLEREQARLLKAEIDRLTARDKANTVRLAALEGELERASNALRSAPPTSSMPESGETSRVASLALLVEELQEVRRVTSLCTLSLLCTHAHAHAHTHTHTRAYTHTHTHTCTCTHMCVGARKHTNWRPMPLVLLQTTLLLGSRLTSATVFVLAALHKAQI